MAFKYRYLTATAAAAMLVAGAAQAQWKQVATVPIPGAPMNGFDISYIDQKTHTFFLADRTNKSIDIIDGKTHKFVGRAEGFIGVVMKTNKEGKQVPDNDKSGPDGVVVTATEIWGSDGDSTIKIFDRKTLKLVDTISTGGKTRVDEMAYDPKDQIFIGVNNAEEPPFATVISTKKGHKVIGKIEFKDAEDGAEQPDYNAADGMFYVSIPQVGKEERDGGVAIIDPKTAKLVKMLPTKDCHGNGLAFGPNQNFMIGCTAIDNVPKRLSIMNAKTGKVVADVMGTGAVDMVAYDSKNKQFYGAGRGPGDNSHMGVVDANTNKLVGEITLAGNGDHSVAADNTTGEVFVPITATGKDGCGCIAVFAPAKAAASKAPAGKKKSS